MGDDTRIGPVIPDEIVQLDPVGSIATRASEILKETETDSAAVGAVVEDGSFGAEARVKKRIGRGWIASVWARWVKGDKSPDVAVTVEKKWGS